MPAKGEIDEVGGFFLEQDRFQDGDLFVNIEDLLCMSYASRKHVKIRYLVMLDIIYVWIVAASLKVTQRVVWEEESPKMPLF